ncbi:MAG: cyclic nucleotide-binding domain-containing protein [Rubrobacter sp.]|jgi:CRP-like cAMP-binding protein|nr:cyclic nucleotide-binding domain-containing protein [Rubrobacter sp.]
MSDPGREAMERDLRKAEFFESLTDDELAEFAEGAERVSFGVGEAMIREGREPECMFVVTYGRMQVCKKVPGGEKVIARIEAGEKPTVVGERGMLAKSGASATVRTRGRVEAIKVRRETFRRMIHDERPAAFKVSYRISRTIAERLTRLDEEVVEMIRDVERKGSPDVEAFRDRLTTEWTI